MSAKRKPNPNVLDATQFADSPAYDLAVVVHRETEAERAIEAQTFKDHPPPTNAIQALLAPPHGSSDFKPWGEYVKSYDVLERCGAALGLPLGVIATRISLELRPENWEVIFWMGTWLRVVDQANDLKAQMREQVETIERSKRDKAVNGAERMHEKNYGAAKRFIQKEWANLRRAFEENKSAFARQYVPKVHSQFGLVITHKTIASSWLKGM